MNYDCTVFHLHENERVRPCDLRIIFASALSNAMMVLGVLISGRRHAPFVLTWCFCVVLQTIHPCCGLLTSFYHQYILKKTEERTACSQESDSETIVANKIQHKNEVEKQRRNCHILDQSITWLARGFCAPHSALCTLAAAHF